MKSFSEALDKALEEVVETRVSERIDHLNSVIEAQKEENLALKIENDNLRAVNLALTKVIDRARDLMRVLDDEFGLRAVNLALTEVIDRARDLDLERNVRDIESSIGELQRELKRSSSER